MPRHRHEHGYVAVVLSGGYHEAGAGGRFDVKAGDVVVHRSFDAHLDRIGAGGAEVLNLPLPATRLPLVFSINNPDEIAREAERSPQDAAVMLTPGGKVTGFDDWPDRLASELASPGHWSLGEWADAAGLRCETLSRGFRKAYGVTPARFRAECRAHRALTLINENRAPLVSVAADCAFADQPHLTREIVYLTGSTPGALRRRSNPFKTGRGEQR